MSESLNYNIHDIIKFEIRRQKKINLLKDVELPFSPFEVDEVNDPDIVLNIGKFKPSNQDCLIIDHKYHVKENYLYCKDNDGIARWEVEISGFEEGKTIVNTRSKILGPPFVLPIDLLPQNLILAPLVEYKLGQRGYFPIHSAGISRDGKAYLLAGRSGTFKTTFAMDLIRRAGFGFLGDERVIVHNDEVLSFPLHMDFFRFRVGLLPTEHTNLLDNIFFVTGLWKKCININALFKTAKSSKLMALIFLVRTNRKAVTPKSLTREESARKLIAGNSIEMISGYPMMMGVTNRVFYKYMLAFSFAFPDSTIATYWDDVGKKLREIIEGIPICEIEIPLGYDLEVFNRVHMIIENL